MSTHDANSMSVRPRLSAGMLIPAMRYALVAVVFALGINASAWAIDDPTDLSGLVLWLDGDDLDGDGTAEGASEAGQTAGVIDTWADKSGVGPYNATQGTGGLQPSYVTGQVNGLAIVRFDGADDFLLNAAISQAQPSTLIIVWQVQEDVSSGDFALTDSNSGASTNTVYVTDGNLYAYAGANPNTVGHAITSPAANAIVTAVEFNGVSSGIYLDGAVQDSGNIGAQALSGLIIGKDFSDTIPIQADVAEVILYSRSLTGPELGAVNEYLGGKWGVTISNTAPVVTAGGVLAYTENAAAAVIDAAVTVTDVDDLDLEGATVSITTGFDAGDVLAADTSGTSISAAYAAGTGVLTLSNTDTVANYQQVLQTVTFTSTNNNPTTPKTVTYAVTDGEDPDSDTATINVTAENDAPTVAAGGPLAYTENDPATVIDASVTVTDPDDTNIEGGTVSITAGFENGDDTLAANTAGTSIVAAYAAGTGVLTLSNADTVANYQQVLRTVTFVSTSEDPAASKTVTYELDDGDDTGSDTVTINITALNEVPTVTAGGTLAYTENDPAAVIDNGVTLADIDDTNFESGTVRITTGFDNGDILAANTGGTSITAAYNAESGVFTLSGADTLAHYQAVLRTVTFRSTNGDPTASKTVTYLVNDGDDNGSDTATINVTAENDGPTLATNAGLTVAQGATATIDNSLLQVEDVDNAAADLTFTIEAAPANGELQLSGAALAATDTFTQADIDGDLLAYAHDNSATTADSFDFTVADGDGGTIGTTTFDITITPAEPNEPNEPNEPATPMPVLGITIAADAETVNVGDEITFIVTVSNTGDGDATDVELVVPVPEIAEFVSGSIGEKQAAQANSSGVTAVDGTITAAIGDLAAGDKVDVTIVLRATAEGSIVLSASVTSAETTSPVTADAPTEVTVGPRLGCIATLCGSCGVFPMLLMLTGLIGMKIHAARRKSARR